MFTSKLTSELCKLLDIKALKTSPYHPQTNGCLERWHGSLKAMLRKCNDRQKEWDRLLKYLLFAYRSTPHTHTGFSPFEIIFGRSVRGPLEVLKEGWLSGEVEEASAVNWINELREKLCLISEIAGENDRKGKAAMKRQYDQKAKPREFEVGGLVLVRKPDLQGKLEDVWDGPFEIIRRISPVTYEMAVPSRRSKRMVVHVNSLKMWVDVEAQVLRVVVAQEDEEEDCSRTQCKLPDQQERDIQQLLEEFQDVVTSVVGKASGVEHRINTGDHQPTQSPPHRLASYWKEQLRTEISELMEAGILKMSHSPWSSPMVPVRKPDGSVRLCIDYRKLNSVTCPDPYAIPLIEDMLDQLGDAPYLTKIDLNKGFYQIQMAVDDVDKTAFCSPWGKFAFTRMPFGLRNAPATFQRHMTQVLSGLEEFTGVYFDDVIIFSQTWEDHLAHLRETLGRLRKNGL